MIGEPKWREMQRARIAALLLRALKKQADRGRAGRGRALRLLAAVEPQRSPASRSK